jgi:hypothetical protein
MPKKKKGKKKRVIKGLMSKLGAILMGAVPPAASGIEAVANAQSHESLDMMGKITVGFQRFCNNLTAGFGLPQAFGHANVKVRDGGMTSIAIGNAWDDPVGGQSAPFLYTTLAGAIMVGVDALMSKFTKSSTRIMGVNITGKY